MSLFLDIGGLDRINRIADPFFRDILQDPVLSPFFGSFSPEESVKRKRYFLLVLFEGPHAYDKHYLKVKHGRISKGRSLQEPFERLIAILISVLREDGVDEKLIDRVEENGRQWLPEVSDNRNWGFLDF